MLSSPPSSTPHPHPHISLAISSKLTIETLFIDSNGAEDTWLIDVEQTDDVNADHRNPSHVISQVDASLTPDRFDLDYLDFKQP